MSFIFVTKTFDLLSLEFGNCGCYQNDAQKEQYENTTKKTNDSMM